MTTSSSSARAADTSISWRLSDLADPAKDAPRVFSCFSGGGGSCMGYRLAGYRVTGACEIDPQMAATYRNNLSHPVYEEPIQALRKRETLPAECLNLDVLDGSPPCSSFSLMGKRDKVWGKERFFREGQASQVLDELFFEFIELAKRAQPKVIVGENVKGLVIGTAKGYAKAITAAFRAAGYDPQLFLLNAATMGVPQIRERVFFIARRADLELPSLSFSFAGRPVSVGEALADADPSGAKPLPPRMMAIWNENPREGKFKESAVAKLKRMETGNQTDYYYSESRLHPHRPALTQTAGRYTTHWKEPRYLSDNEIARLFSFPDDYQFDKPPASYVCGMSVPPRMTAAIASEIRRQCLDQGS